MATTQETLRFIGIAEEFQSRQTLRDAVAGHATTLQKLTAGIQDVLSHNPTLTPEIDHASDGRVKEVVTTIHPASQDYFLYPFRIIEKDFHVEPKPEQLNGSPKPVWSIRFEDELNGVDGKEDFFPFFEFVRLTSGECKMLGRAGGQEFSFDSREITTPQELKKAVRPMYEVLSQLGIDYNFLAQTTPS